MNRPVRWGPWIAAGALALLLMLAALAVVTGRQWGTPVSSVTPIEPAESLAVALDQALQRGGETLPGLALRPMVAASAPAETVALANAVCGALAERLARLPNLRVVPCRSTAAAVATALDNRRLARLLAVRHVLTGTVEPLADDRLLVQLSLQEASTGREVWRLEESIAAGAMQSLPTRVAAAAGAALGIVHAPATEALIEPALYAVYLRARDLSRRPSLDDRRKALDLLD
jgi:TolB-like protein